MSVNRILLILCGCYCILKKRVLGEMGTYQNKLIIIEGWQGVELNAYVRLYLWYRMLGVLLKMVLEKGKIRELNAVLRHFHLV